MSTPKKPREEQIDRAKMWCLLEVYKDEKITRLYEEEEAMGPRCRERNKPELILVLWLHAGRAFSPLPIS